jgi:hypothetical protein
MEYRAPREIPTTLASGRERLSRLAAFLDGLAPEKLTLTRWYGDGIGCAVGLAAALDPWFKAQGVRLVDQDDFKQCRPVYQDKTDWRAVASFFQIGINEAAHLFGRRSYAKQAQPHPSRMAARIRAYLACTGPDAGHEQAKVTPGPAPRAVSRPPRTDAGADRIAVHA